MPAGQSAQVVLETTRRGEHAGSDIFRSPQKSAGWLFMSYRVQVKTRVVLALSYHHGCGNVKYLLFADKMSESHHTTLLLFLISLSNMSTVRGAMQQLWVNSVTCGIAKWPRSYRRPWYASSLRGQLGDTRCVSRSLLLGQVESVARRI
jgi:hypothetical protein